jgi:hypothetical protein
VWPGGIQRSRPAVSFAVVAVIAALAVVASSLLQFWSQLDGPAAPSEAPPAPAVVPAVESPEGPSPTPVPNVTFTSELYDYRLVIPATWDVTPATDRWTGGEPRFEGPYADRFGADQLSIVSVDLPSGAPVESWIGEVPRPAAWAITGSANRFCDFDGRWFEGAGAHAKWTATTLSGRPAYIRALCGQVDAVIDDGDRAVIVGLQTGRSVTGDTDALRAVVAGLDLGAPPAAARDRLGPNDDITYSSRRHGYRATVPWPLERQMAIESLPGAMLTDGDAMDPRVDRIGIRGDRGLWVASVPIGAVTAADVARSVPRRQGGSPDGAAGLTCTLEGRFASRLPPESWRSTAIGEVPAMERDSCYFIDVVAVVGGRAYLISARSPDASSTFASARIYLDDFLATLEFLPAEAVDPE